MKRVLTISDKDIEKFTDNVVEKFLENNKKTLILGVASGGLPLAKEIFTKCRETGGKADYGEVLCRRPSTKNKNSNITGALFSFSFRFFPQWILNFLRVFEHFILSKKRNQAREVIYVASLQLCNYDLVLLVDDAVDSGYSLKAVFDDIHAKGFSFKVNTAVFVTTQNKPIFNADYSYMSDVLVRFPWSKDA